jgi:hypothetical protein
MTDVHICISSREAHKPLVGISSLQLDHTPSHFSIPVFDTGAQYHGRIAICNTDELFAGEESWGDVHLVNFYTLVLVKHHTKIMPSNILVVLNAN